MSIPAALNSPSRFFLDRLVRGIITATENVLSKWQKTVRRSFHGQTRGKSMRLSLVCWFSSFLFKEVGRRSDLKIFFNVWSAWNGAWRNLELSILNASGSNSFWLNLSTNKCSSDCYGFPYPFSLSAPEFPADYPCPNMSRRLISRRAVLIWTAMTKERRKFHQIFSDRLNWAPFWPLADTYWNYWSSAMTRTIKSKDQSSSILWSDHWRSPCSNAINSLEVSFKS